MLGLSFNQLITTSIGAQNYMGMEQLEPYYISESFGHGTRGQRVKYV